MLVSHAIVMHLAWWIQQVEDARAVLQAIRERSGDKPDEVLVNIAHLFTAQVRVCCWWSAVTVHKICVRVRRCVGCSNCVRKCCPRCGLTNPPPRAIGTHHTQGQRNAAIHCYETFLKKKLPGTTGSDALLHGKVLEYVGHAHYLDKRYEVCMCVSCAWGGSAHEDGDEASLPALPPAS